MFATDSRGFLNNSKLFDLDLHNITTEEIRTRFLARTFDSGRPRPFYWSTTETPTELIHLTKEEAIASFVKENKQSSTVSLYAWVLVKPILHRQNKELKRKFQELDTAKGGRISNRGTFTEDEDALLGELFSDIINWQVRRARGFDEVILLDAPQPNTPQPIVAPGRAKKVK